MYVYIYIHPFLGTLNIRCRLTIRTQKVTTILTTTHMSSGLGFRVYIYIII